MQGWWFEKDGETVGPVSEAELITFMRANSQKSMQLVWTAGMPEWTDARKLAQFADVFGPTPPPLPKAAQKPTLTPPISRPRIEPVEQIEPPETIEEIRATSSVHPWRRYFARMFDWLIANIIFFVIFIAVVVGYRISLTGGALVTVFYAGSMIFAMFLEATFLAMFGTTPGKALYGIRIRPRMNFSIALRRSWLVLLQGLWLGIPIVALIGVYLGYMRLTETGRTSWDDDLRLEVTHAEIGALRWTGIVVAWLVFVIVWTALTR